MEGTIALGEKLNKLPNDKDRVKLCLFIIQNGLGHPDNIKARVAGFFCHGYLGSLLQRYQLNDFGN